MSDDKILIESEFKEFMRRVFPNLKRDCSQSKVMRLAYYAGAYNLITHKEGEKEKRIRSFDSMVEELKSSMEFAVDAARKGMSPEEALSDLVEHRGESS